MPVFHALFLAFLLGVVGYGQPAPEWETLSSEKGDMLMSLPKDPVVIRRESMVWIEASAGQCAFTVVRDKFNDPGSYIKEMKFQGQNTAPLENLQRGSFVVKRWDREQDGTYAVYIFAGSRSTYYSVVAAAPSRSDPLIKNFLDSIVLDGQPLYGGPPPSAASAPAKTIIEKLKTSPVVEAALNRKCSNKLEYGYARPGQQFTDHNIYSRRLIIVSKPRAQEAQFQAFTGYRGKVVLRLLFGADGCLGPALVISEMTDKSKTWDALRAATQIRFLPAEVNGKPTDSYKNVDYEFGN